MRKTSLLGIAALAAVAGLGSGGASVLPREYRDAPSLNPRRRGHRKGRRFGYGAGLVEHGNINPPGTKLAKKATKGTLTLNGLR